MGSWDASCPCLKRFICRPAICLPSTVRIMAAHQPTSTHPKAGQRQWSLWRWGLGVAGRWTLVHYSGSPLARSPGKTVIAECPSWTRSPKTVRCSGLGGMCCSSIFTVEKLAAFDGATSEVPEPKIRQLLYGQSVLEGSWPCSRISADGFFLFTRSIDLFEPLEDCRAMQAIQ